MPDESAAPAAPVDLVLAEDAALDEQRELVHLPGTGPVEVESLAALPGGDVLVGIAFEGQLSVVTPALVSAGEGDIAVLRMAPDGRFAWGWRLGGSAHDQGAVVSFEPGLGVALGGSFRDALDGVAEPVRSAGETDGVVALVSADGATLEWVRRVGGSAGDGVDALSAGDGAVCAGGFFGDVLAHGEASVTATARSNGFVACFDRTGAPMGLYPFLSDGTSRVRALARAPGGVLIAAGTFSGVLQTPGGPIEASGRSDIFVAFIPTAGRSIGEVHTLGSDGSDRVSALAAGRDGRAYLAGAFGGVLADTAVGALSPGGQRSPLVAAVDRRGVAWLRGFPSELPASARAIDLEAASGDAKPAVRRVVVGGEFSGELDLGDGVMQSADLSGDVFVLSLDAGGAVLGSAFAGGSGHEHLDAGVLVGPGNFVIGGHFEGESAIGDTRVTADSNDDGFVAVVAAPGGADAPVDGGAGTGQSTGGQAAAPDGTAVEPRANGTGSDDSPGDAPSGSLPPRDP